jgi:hypothetical protein
LGKAPHLERVLDRLPGPAHTRSVGTVDDGNYAEIEPGRGAAVEPQLLFAEETTLLERAEIEEAEVHRLLDLVGVLAGEEYPRDMRFDQLDRSGRFRVAPSLAQSGDQAVRFGCF